MRAQNIQKLDKSMRGACTIYARHLTQFVTPRAALSVLPVFAVLDLLLTKESISTWFILTYIITGSDHAHLKILGRCHVTKNLKWVWLLSVTRYVKINHTNRFLVEKYG